MRTTIGIDDELLGKAMKLLGPTDRTVLLREGLKAGRSAGAFGRGHASGVAVPASTAVVPGVGTGDVTTVVADDFALACVWIRLPCNGDRARLDRMPRLSVASAHPGLMPTIRCRQRQEIPNSTFCDTLPSDRPACGAAAAAALERAEGCHDVRSLPGWTHWSDRAAARRMLIDPRVACSTTPPHSPAGACPAFSHGAANPESRRQCTWRGGPARTAAVPGGAV
jgi:hypothetical protein